MGPFFAVTVLIQILIPCLLWPVGASLGSFLSLSNMVPGVTESFLAFCIIRCSGLISRVFVPDCKPAISSRGGYDQSGHCGADCHWVAQCFWPFRWPGPGNTLFKREHAMSSYWSFNKFRTPWPYLTFFTSSVHLFSFRLEILIPKDRNVITYLL